MKVKLLSENAVLPTKRDSDVGFDLYTSEKHVVGLEPVRMHTGIAIELPPGYFAQIVPRSSTLKGYGIRVEIGTIDNGYRGELLVQATSISQYSVMVPSGSKIAQLIVYRQSDVFVEQVDELSDTQRGDNGFGSTGL